MLKKFVPLTADVSPTKNPYQVRTYAGDIYGQEWKLERCEHFRKCPLNSTISHVITLEDELRMVAEKARAARFLRPYQKKCAYYDDYTVCIATQRTPQELKTHAVMRELYIKEKTNQTQLDFARKFDDPEVVYLPAPLGEDGEGEEEPDSDFPVEGEEGDEKKKAAKPEMASPTCSDDVLFIPPKKVLDVKRPKTGYFHNETEEPKVPDVGIDYSRYDPRIIQTDLEKQKLSKVDLIEGGAPDDLWTWNVGYQQREADLDDTYLYAKIPYLDCHRWRLRVYNIPDDLDKTFTAVIVFGSSSVKPEPPPRKAPYYIRPKEIACIYVGYAESFHLNPDFWIPKTMNSILKRGEKLNKLSESLNYKAKDSDFDIINQVPERKAIMNLRHHFSGTIINEPNIYKILTLFFYKYNAAVFVSKNIYLLIWKRCLNSFYVFDPNGRDELCQRDFEDGKCSLMDTQYVEHLVHLIVNCSGAEKGDPFTLYEIYLQNFGKIDQPMPKFEERLVRRIWAVVNNSYALIPSYKEGLSPPNSAVEHNASMVVSLIALIYANIEFPMKWRMQTIDDIIKFGLKFNRHLRLKYKLRKYNEQLNILDMPDALMMVSYRCFQKKFPFMYSGHIAECTSFVESQLTKALKDLFVGGSVDAALLQIDNSVLGVWKDTKVFYVFDPFRRGNAGLVLDPDDYRAIGAACLQMHSNLESLCRILYQKALQMRRGGKLFIHGYIIGCIKQKQSYVGKNRWPNLKLLPVKYGADQDSPAAPEPPQKKGKKGKKGKKKPKALPEIAHLKDEERLPEYDEDDVVETIFEEMVREIIDGLEEPIIKRPPLYKQAKKVLLKSDSEYLKSLKHKLIHHRDPDQLYNVQEVCPVPAKVRVTIEEELAKHTNYELMPDGTYIVFGSTDLPDLKDETLSKLGGLLAGLVTLALTVKYKISTWNSQLIEYALDSVNSFNEDFKDYSSSLMYLLSNKAPKISIGDTLVELKVQKIVKSEILKPLKQVLLEVLADHKKILVICQRFSCVIVKQYNFLYQFIGFPTGPTGFRKYGSGPASVIRALEIDAVLRRLEVACNPAGCEVTNFVVLAIRPHVPDLPMFVEFDKPRQKSLYKEALARKQQELYVDRAKKEFLDDTLKQERKRIRKFYREKARRERRKNRPIMFDEEGNKIDYESEEQETMEEEQGEGEEEIMPKHKPGTKLKMPKLESFVPHPLLYGYHMRQKDCLFKIQGSKGMEGRDTYSIEEIKSCYFGSILAILYSILRPLNEWHSGRIDSIIECAQHIASKVEDMEMAPQRIIKNITVDDFMFDVWVKEYEPMGVAGFPFPKVLAKVIACNKYFLLFTGNTTYVVYYDEYFHLFDPYNSMVTLNGGDEDGGGGGEENFEKKKKHCTRGIQQYGERDTASWVLFRNVDDMVNYINARNSNPDWKENAEYKFFTVNVIKYKKAPRNAQLLQLLTDFTIPRCCNTEVNYGRGDEQICARDESMSWLDIDNCIPVWSRLNRRNASGHYRNLPVSKIKNYDIEIAGRLWSIWGNLHPDAPVFEESSRGKSHFACYVIAFCAATSYHLMDFGPNLIDTIVINGNRFHQFSMKHIKKKDYEFALEDLETECWLENIKYYLNIQFRAYGKLYIESSPETMNLAEALIYFFSFFRFGILQCGARSLAIGYTPQHDGGYFMFDCQSQDLPLFPRGQGAAYLLRTRHLQVLLYLIVVTLNVRYYNVEFTIHEVQVALEDTEQGDGGEGGADAE